MRGCLKLLGLLSLLGLAACDSGRHSSAGFRLPADGNVERGKATLVAYGCHNCHKVSGTDLPAPTIQPPVLVMIGGEVDSEISDGYLVTAVINPSYHYAHHPVDKFGIGGRSRMPSYSDKMTVQQLTDLVAFIQTRYSVRLPSRYSYY